MRILAFSDLHCLEPAAEAMVLASKDADVVVGAGDFGIRGERCEYTLNLLTGITCPFILVSGNHDVRSAIAAFCKKMPNWHVLHGSSITIKDINFLGIGGEIPRIGSADWNESIEEDDARDLLAHSQSCNVLVSHTPPLGYTDLQSNGAHEGSKAVYEAVVRDQPSLCLCGHIHHSWGAIEKINTTVVHNLGPTINWYTV